MYYINSLYIYIYYTGRIIKITDNPTLNAYLSTRTNIYTYKYIMYFVSIRV
jgi:hypothetical protein